MSSVRREPEIIGIVRRIFSKVSSIDKKIPLPESDEDQYPKKVFVFILTIFGILGGASLIGAVTSYFSEALYYSAGFEEGISTYSNEEAFALITQDLRLSLYGYEGRPVTLSSTDLRSEAGGEIGSGNINFRRLNPITDQPGIFSVETQVNPFLRGTFTGFLLLKNGVSTAYIPFTIASGTYVLAPILLVLTGVCTSVCLWEIIRFYKYKPAMDKRNVALQELKTIEQNITGKYKDVSLDDIKMDLGDYLPTYRKTEQRISYYDVILRPYFERDQQSAKTLASIGVLEFISALFGIAIGLVITFNDVLSSNDVVIDMQKAILLFGIGLGTGSLKELVDK